MSVRPALDREGYLRELEAWSPEVAAWLAEREGIGLGEAHWEIVQLLRDFYAEFGRAPNNRALVNAVKRELGPEKERSIYLLELFPGRESPAKIAARIAGLPRPANCD